MFCRFLISKVIKIGLLVQKLRQFLLILVQKFSTFGDFRNPSRTSESPQISTRWSQTPDEGIRTLNCKYGTREVFDDSQFRGNIEGIPGAKHMCCAN